MNIYALMQKNKSDSWRNEKMSKIESFSEGQIESLAKVLGDCGTGSDITRILSNMNIHDDSGQSTKWKRIYWIFLNFQKEYNCANQILDFIQKFLTPTRFTGRSEQFETHRNNLNEILVFSGIELGKDGKFRNCEKVHTLDEAEQRVHII